MEQIFRNMLSLAIGRYGNSYSDLSSNRAIIGQDRSFYQLLEAGHLFHLHAVNCDVSIGVLRALTMIFDFVMLAHIPYPPSVSASFDEVFDITAGATDGVKVISESQVMYGCGTHGDGCVVVFISLFYRKK
ncbi:hypothetical protein DPMN_116568 [Dreissena polymorpha]|uniref:Uncharacterized protein n=1 Tax=Dreissena polymorpha TaxID=45954 RepID=A0A9D4QTI6_DREPO|nr:hypothetical protein DPMN_116568 [Dreissena polymorpha]